MEHQAYLYYHECVSVLSPSGYVLMCWILEHSGNVSLVDVLSSTIVLPIKLANLENG